MEKSKAREIVFIKRRQLSDDDVVKMSHVICRKLIDSSNGIDPELKEIIANFDELFTYMNFGKEVSTRLLVKETWSAGKKVAAPRVYIRACADDIHAGTEHIMTDKTVGDAEKRMEFFYINGFDDLELSPEGVSEPKPGCKTAEEERCGTANRLIIMPGVAFDVHGGRVGYGGGFYDRWFGERTSAERKHMICIALAFEFQIMDEDICTAKHDIKPDFIITEQRIIRP